MSATLSHLHGDHFVEINRGNEYLEGVWKKFKESNHERKALLQIKLIGKKSIGSEVKVVSLLHLLF